MILTTASITQGKKIDEYLGVVTGDVIYGVNVLRDMFAGMRDFMGGRTASYEKLLRKAKQKALSDMLSAAKSRGANAVIGITYDVEAIGKNSQMLCVSVTGSAVRLKQPLSY